MWSWDWDRFIILRWRKARETRQLACFLAHTIISEPHTIIKETRLGMKNLPIKPKFCSHFLAPQNMEKPSPHTIKHTTLKESPTNRKTNNFSTVKRLTKNGKSTIPTRKGTTELLLSFPSTLKKAKRQNLFPLMKMSGSPTSTEPARISMKLWPDPVHQPVNSFSMKSEETSETPNDKQNCDFLFRSNNLSKDVTFEWKWRNLKIIKS